jgi:hypothetical protein
VVLLFLGGRLQSLRHVLVRRTLAHVQLRAVPAAGGAEERAVLRRVLVLVPRDGGVVVPLVEAQRPPGLVGDTVVVVVKLPLDLVPQGTEAVLVGGRELGALRVTGAVAVVGLSVLFGILGSAAARTRRRRLLLLLRRRARTAAFGSRRLLLLLWHFRFLLATRRHGRP